MSTTKMSKVSVVAIALLAVNFLLFGANMLVPDSASGTVDFMYVVLLVMPTAILVGAYEIPRHGGFQKPGTEQAVKPAGAPSGIMYRVLQAWCLVLVLALGVQGAMLAGLF